MAVMGKEESALFDSLKWAAELKIALEQGLETTLRELQQIRDAIASLPHTGTPAVLREELAEPLAQIAERLQQADFYRASADLASRLTQLRTRIRAAVETMQAAQATRIKEAESALQRVPEWIELSLPEQQELLGQLEALALVASADLAGLKALINREFEIQDQVQQLRRRIEQLGRERLQARLAEEQAPLGVHEGPKTIKRRIKTRARITDLAALDAMIQDLQKLRGELKYAHSFELDVELD